VPELPDLIVYIDALRRHIVGRQLENIRLRSPFVLRSVDPPLESIFGREVRDVGRIGKRLVLTCGDAGFLVIHLMIAGRLKWQPKRDEGAVESPSRARPSTKLTLAVFEFSHGSLYFTEASSKKRASLQVVGNLTDLHKIDPGGIEPLEVTFDQFRGALVYENHTIKRALTDPHLFSGIGNAYSDEILHAARLSPLKLTRSLSGEESRRLYDATRATLVVWIDQLRRDLGGAFPEKVTAFRDAMAVHGRFRQPCPVCGSPVQRIVYAENECNYCATCQTGGRLLADRSLSRLLKDDWPRRLDE
jgi:formamidopyrimidine-DNA glycosylase